MSSHPSSTPAPQGEPAVRRRFQLTNLVGNNNKYWTIELWPLGDGKVQMRASYGRVGSRPQIDEKIMSMAAVERRIAEKERKGYREVDLQRTTDAPSVTTDGSRLDGRVQRLVDWIFAEAGEGIASYLAIDINGLSQAQIDRGRQLLTLAQQQHTAWKQQQSAAALGVLADTVQQFYNAIPTQLPSRIDPETVVLDFCAHADTQEDRLNQLEAAVAINTTQDREPQLSRYEALGARITPLATGDAAYGRIVDMIDQTCVHGYRVRVNDIFTVDVPSERQAFEQNQRGRDRVDLLFHGTPGQNVRHILRSGLICPRTPSHGRMFGHGIYFANKVSKSANYCSTRSRSAPRFLFLADVALGRSYVANRIMPDRRSAPWFHDSVWGKAGHPLLMGGSLHYDEFIVYRAEQQSIRYLVTFDR